MFNLLYALVVTSYTCLLKPQISVLFNLLYVLSLQLKDANGLHALVGDAIFEMMDRKKVIFPKATLSQKSFLSIAPWRRAMIFVFLSRFLCNKKGQQRWRNYSMEDYKFNIRAFRRYMLKDTEILDKTQRFLDLPPDLPQDGKEKKRPLPTSDSMTEAARMKFTVDDSSSDEEVSPALPVVVTTAGHPATDGHQTANKRKPATDGQTANKRKKSMKTKQAPAVLFSDDTTSDDSTHDDGSSYHTEDDEDDAAHDV